MTNTNRRKSALLLCAIMLVHTLFPPLANALTGGPSLPDFEDFEPIGTTEMVNLPNGDFTYNIALGEVGGYPLNLSYHSGITADTEASSVGLGWSINPGVINRNVRAIPDDFDGTDEVNKEFNMRPNVTVGASVTAGDFELFGKKHSNLYGKFGLNMGVFVNNYSGLGYEFGLTPSLSSGAKGFDRFTAKMGFSLNSKDGASFNPSLAFSHKITGIEDHANSLTRFGAKIGLAIHSREGLYARSISASITDETEGYDKEKNKSGSWSGSFGTSAKYSYATKSFTPGITMPQNNFSATFSYKPFGLELFGTNTSTSFSGYISTQQLRNDTVSKRAYGLLYAEKGKDDVHALMDFSREKETIYQDYAVNLPIVNPGYDILSVAGQGIGGSYQLKRSDVPIFFDSKSTAVSNGGSLGLEVGTGQVFHGGVDVTYNNTNSFSEKWQSGNNLLNKYELSTNTGNAYEPAYYKAAGEMAVETDPDFYLDLGEDRAVRADLYEPGASKFDVQTRDRLRDVDGRLVRNLSGKATRENRERRNQVISYLTASEAERVGLEKKILDYPYNQFIGITPGEHNRVASRDGKKAHHISQIEALRPDGMRYVYGIPAYNLSQEEVSFNAAGQTVKCERGNVSYDARDASVDNDRGNDHFYSAVKTPAYAHSYLLTAVLSADYEDLTGDGLSAEDPGSWTRFNYSRLAGPRGSAHWRVPFQQNEATYNPGIFSKDSDDKGSFIYGTKEVWLVHSVESKTMIAEFTYSDRLDGYGVAGRDGGIAATNYSKKLDKITIYAKPDRLANGNNATPIKTISFVYNYELCHNTPNSTAPGTQGKLTLKEVYFTYGHSRKGKLSSYKFHYKNATTGYDRQSYDRWGYYKRNTPNLDCAKIQPGQPIPNDEYPYSEQDPAIAGADAGTWSLATIELPSGGSIQVDYAAKHYAYVQDRPAMQMFQITGVGSPGDDNLYDYNPLNNNRAPRKRIFFKLKGPIPTKSELRRDYLREFDLENDYVYLKCFVLMNTSFVGEPEKEKWEYVSLYSKIMDYGVANGQGYIDVEPLLADDNDDGQAPRLNPISKFSFQFIREFMPDLAYGDGAVPVADIWDNPLRLLKPLASMGQQLAQFVTGFNRILLIRGMARKIDIQGRSVVRLTTPDGFKMGGGSMVSKIEIHDHWGDMIGDVSQNFHYGQTYDYTTTDAATGRTISSGVAAYEPAIGGDENAFREPVVIGEERKWAIDNVHYVEKPYGESFMPAPSVVFSEITVRNLARTNTSGIVNVRRTATGHAVMKYFTAKDFPTILRETDIQKEPRRTKPILSLLKVKMKEHANNSQGFLIKNNNMHGQARANEVYDENGTLISKVAYFYKTKPNGELDNEVEVMQADGTTIKGWLGLDYQLAGDARQSSSKTISAGLSLNTDGFLVGIIPTVIPVPWPNYETNERRYRSLSMTKVMFQSGVLDSVVAFDLGSTIATKNEVWDAETGEVLLTKTYNEFEDPIYNFKLPAHLYYAGMQGAYQNIGAEATLTHQGGGVYAVGAAASFLIPGDELDIGGYNGFNRAWVLHVNTSTRQIFLIGREGQALVLPGSFTGKVIRSGHRNMPSAAIASLTSKQNPFVGGNLQLGTGTEVLNAGAVAYSDAWQTFCDGRENVENNCFETGVINPFVRNVRGDWRAKKSWVYLTERNRKPLASTASSTNIRENGSYKNFSSFWHYDASTTQWQPRPTGWEWTTEVTQVNPNGTELESRDVLDRYAAEITGYFGQLVTGVAANSKYQQIAFDGFEDYRYEAALRGGPQPCLLPRHFTTNYAAAGSLAKISDEQHHTGNYALEVPANSRVSTTYSVVAPSPCPPTSPPATNMEPFEMEDCDCVRAFSPEPGRYVVTAWVKEGAKQGPGEYQYQNHKLRIVTRGSAGTKTNDFVASGHIIEGWQRMEGIIEIKPQDTNVDIIFEAGGGRQPVYFDDFRIFPFAGDMKNFVYDDISLKLLAELDVNGYAKFYEYDPAGQLIRVKKETERGVMTIQESAAGQPK